MLGRRLFSAFVIVSVMLLLLRLDFWLGSDAGWSKPGIVLSILAMLLAMLSAQEMISLWPESQRPNQTVVVYSALIMTLVAFTPAFISQPFDVLADSGAATALSVYPVDHVVDEERGESFTYERASRDLFIWSFSGLVLAVVITFCFEMFQFKAESRNPGEVTDRLGRATLIYVYLSMLFGFLIPHRMIGDENGMGLLSLIALISTVKLSDSFAYFAGKSFGTTKMAPVLSPKKTVQGALGALVGGCVAVAIVVYLVAPLIFGLALTQPWWWLLVYGFLVTAAGMTGDLAESLLKRDADCKDSSRWLPGLGGMLDVLDSLIFAAPVSYFLWKLSI